MGSLVVKDSIVTRDPNFPTYRTCLLEVEVAGERHLLSASSNEDKDAWLTLLNDASRGITSKSFLKVDKKVFFLTNVLIPKGLFNAGLDRTRIFTR